MGNLKNIQRISMGIAIVLSISLIFTGSVSAQELQGTEQAKGLLTDVAKWLLAICVAIATIMIVVGGIMWMTSTGNPGKMATAKATVINTVIGLALAVGATLIASTIYGIATNRLG